MSFLAAPLLAVLALLGCGECDLSGYTPMRVSLIYGAPAVAGTAGGCAVYTDIPHDGNPDAHPEALRHIGASVYACLSGTVTTVADGATGAFYSEILRFRINGDCPVIPNFTTYGCFNHRCRTVNTVLDNIGAGCPAQQALWNDACWTQFYKVLGHEVAHGWLGEFHK